MRNISVEELCGFRDALLEMRIPVDLSEFAPIDIVGTGGDGKIHLIFLQLPVLLLPEPVSPVTSTVVRVGATFSIPCRKAASPAHCRIRS